MLPTLLPLGALHPFLLNQHFIITLDRITATAVAHQKCWSHLGARCIQ